MFKVVFLLYLIFYTHTHLFYPTVKDKAKLNNRI